MFYGKNMTSNDTDDVLLGKINYLKRNAKSGVNINRFVSKFHFVFILGQVVAV